METPNINVERDSRGGEVPTGYYAKGGFARRGTDTIPAMLTQITSVLSREGVNVENLTNKSKKDYAYTMLDINSRIKDSVADELRAISGVIRVRVLNH